MKKIGKNTKLYLIGMIIGGITLGITTVIADTIINSTSVAYKTTTVKAALDELYDIADFKEEVKDMLYPVGSIYISVSSTNPSQLFGGTWVSFGMGRTLLGTGLNEANNRFDHGSLEAGKFVIENAEQKGGEYTHTLTVAEMPEHRHRGRLALDQTGYGTSIAGYEAYLKIGSYPNSNITYLDSGNTLTDRNMRWLGETTLEGGSGTHNNIPPYITVYMWKRTA